MFFFIYYYIKLCSLLFCRRLFRFFFSLNSFCHGDFIYFINGYAFIILYLSYEKVCSHIFLHSSLALFPLLCANIYRVVIPKTLRYSLGIRIDALFAELIELISEAQFELKERRAEIIGKAVN